MKNAAKKRLTWVDNMRGITILLVVLFHSPLHPLMTLFLPGGRLALLFFISGILTKTNSRFPDFLKNRFMRLMVPYFVYAFFSYGLFLVRKLINPDYLNAWDPVQLFFGIFYGVGKPEWMIFNIPLWFLPCLFITQCLLYFYSKLPKLVFYLALIVSPAVCFWCERHVHFSLPWTLNYAFEAVAYMGLGLIFSRKLLSMKTFPLKPIFCFLAFIVVDIILVLIHTNTINQSLLGYYATQVTTVCMILFVVGALFSAPRIQSLSYMGKYSLQILGLHSIIFMGIMLILKKGLHYQINSSVDNLLDLYPLIEVLMLSLCFAIPGIILPIKISRTYRYFRSKVKHYFRTQMLLHEMDMSIQNIILLLTMKVRHALPLR